MDNQFQPLETGEVLSVDDSSQILIGHHTFRAGEFSEAIRAQMEYGLGGWTEEKDAWFSDRGVYCEVLKFGATQWKKGRVRIRLEFCSDDGSQPPIAPAAVATPINVPPPATPAVADDLDFESAAAIAEELEATPFSGQQSSPSPDLELAEASALDDLSIPMVFEQEADLTGMEDYAPEIAPDIANNLDDDFAGVNFEDNSLDENGFGETSFPENSFGEDSFPENNFGENSFAENNFKVDEMPDPFGMDMGDDLSLGEDLGSPNILVVEEEEILIDLSEPNATQKEEESSLLDDVWQDLNQSGLLDDL